MTAFLRTGRTVRTIKLKTQGGAWITRTSGTRDAVTARKMQRMADELGALELRAWDIIGRVEAKTLSIPDLWDLWVATGKDVDAIRARLDDVDLEPMVETWHTAMSGPAGGIAQDTADHYRAAVRTLIAEGTPFRRSALTTKTLTDWIEDMEGVEPATVRKRGQGMRRFVQWLMQKRVLVADPMRDVQLPAPADPRINYLDTEDAKRLADAQPGQYAAFSALLAGSGIDVSTALTIRKRDLDELHKEIRAAGTKTYSRDRVVRVAEWAWKYIKPLAKGRTPDALLFDEIRDRWTARDVHADAIASLVAKGHRIYEGYTMRDQRHTYAVRAIRAGTPAELVARQLGHVNAVLVHRVYGRFAPSQDERAKWEKIADAQDQATSKRNKRQSKHA